MAQLTLTWSLQRLMLGTAPLDLGTGQILYENAEVGGGASSYINQDCRKVGVAVSKLGFDLLGTWGNLKLRLASCLNGSFT